MKKFLKIFGLVRNERGFVLIEFIIGLPLILILLWSLNNLFINTWQKYQYSVADFILRQEMESVMQRMVEDVKRAHYVDMIQDNLYLRYHKLNKSDDFAFFNANNPELKVIKYDSTLSDSERMEKVRSITSSATEGADYIRNMQEIYYKSTNNPITGESILSKTQVTKFKTELVKDKLLKITLEAKSAVSGHSITLRTKVYIRGQIYDE